MKSKKRPGFKGRRKTKNQSSSVLLPLVVGLLFLGAVIVVYLQLPEPSVSAKYLLEDVANSQPIFAQHEMGSGPEIPFLSKAEPQPRIDIPQMFHDFGVIGARDIVVQEFIIRNTGEAPLTISRAYTTCGCTTAEISARIIPPGKVATVRLVFDAGYHDAGGQTVRRGLIIENNDPNQSQAEIWIQATVRSS